jgi:hypothetical protein
MKALQMIIHLKSRFYNRNPYLKCKQWQTKTSSTPSS